MLNVQGNTITEFGPLRSLMMKTPLISLIISDNEVGSDFFESVGLEFTSLIELGLENCKLSNRSMADLALQVREHRWLLQKLNISRNMITSEGIGKLLYGFKNH